VRQVLTPRWLGWHLLALVAFGGCLALGWWQFRRASGGNGLSWAYTFEWPVFAGFVVLVWAHAVRDALRGVTRERPAPDAPPPLVPPPMAPPRSRAVPTPADPDDPELSAYNRYLAWLNANPDRRPSEFPG
jgi:DNA-binding transcriptional regulator of glucitol operon